MNALPRRRLAVATALVAVGCLVASACTPFARYQVLSTVFDGVPPPEGFELPLGAAPSEDGGRVSALGEGLRKLRAQRPERPPAPRILSTHAPVANRQCNQCHDMNQPGDGLVNDITLCDRCHGDQRRDGGWDHGPMNLGTCAPCHVPHRSPYEHLLSDSIPSLCTGCHVEVKPNAPEYHNVENFADCTVCHDPHRMN